MPKTLSGISEKMMFLYWKNMKKCLILSRRNEKYHVFTRQEILCKKSYEYDVFGSIIKEQGQSRNRLTYTEQFYDTVLGQYYLRARYYNPRIAKFIQEDPYCRDGLNLYAYCHNPPVGYYDPSGYMYGISKEKYNILILLNIIGCNRQKKMVSLKE